MVEQINKQKQKEHSGFLNPVASCRRYNIKLYECPQFLFLLMGIIIIGVIVATFFIATTQIQNPRLVSLLVLGLAGLLLIIDYIIVNSFERMAEAARMKTEFVGIVSHQLRSPLTNLKFSLEVLMSGKLKETGESEVDYFKILRENIERMNDLINDLLLISRLETGEFPLHKTEVSLAEMTKDLVNKFRPFAEASNVAIKLDIAKNISNVFADNLWLEQVVKNLIDNAVRYMHGKGEVDITITQEKKAVMFVIADNGVGIPKEEQKYIFQKFFRSKNAVRHQTEGSGLGLHITKKILEFFNGKIWFESQENKGTKFSFILPAYNKSLSLLKIKK